MLTQKNVARFVALTVFLLFAFAFADENNAAPEDIHLAGATSTPTAFLEKSQIIGTGTQIQVFRVPAMDADGNVTYYDLTIPLTVAGNGKIANKARIQSVVSPMLFSNEFVQGEYGDTLGATCTVGTSILDGGRLEMAFVCTRIYGTSTKETISGSVISGPISGHPYELDLLAAEIDNIPGYANYSWGKISLEKGTNSWWDGFQVNDIISCRQVGSVIQISDYGAGNTMLRGASLVRQ